jgi:ATP-dependent DNA ligase
MAVGKLPVGSCLIDGEAIVCDANGLAVFDLIRRHGALASLASTSRFERLLGGSRLIFVAGRLDAGL